MASLDDVISVQKNGVIGVNGIAQVYRRIAGTATSAVATTDTLVIAGPGRLVGFVVIDGGSSAGAIYNAGSTTLAASANKLCVTTTVAGIYQAGLEFTNGLVIKPGTGQSINVTYTPGL